MLFWLAMHETFEKNVMQMKMQHGFSIVIPVVIVVNLRLNSKSERKNSDAGKILEKCS